MALAITIEQEQLAEAVTQFAARHAPIDKTRAALDSIAAGELPTWWEEFTANGFHAVHLPEEAGGQGGTLADMACVIEAAAAALLPGPLLSTAAASAVAALADDSAAALVADLAGGATAAVVLPEDSTVRAVRDDEGWRLSGSIGSTLGLVAAQRILLAAHEGDTVLWFALDAGSNIAVEQQRGTDLSTDVGILGLDDYPAATPVTGIDTERARCVVAGLTACASAGTVRKGVETAVNYIRTREQFGKPVGSFQALQHKAAILLVNAELASATAWDAVRAIDESIEQHRLAASSAALMAVCAGPDLMLDALLMFGAIGYTWEHDTHLYWRRATSLAASLGTTTRWAREAGELARTLKRSTAVNLGDIESEFRAGIAKTLDEAAALQDETPTDDVRAPGLAFGSRRNLLADAGLVAPHLPAPWGLDATPVQQVIITEEFDKRGMIRPSLSIAEWILPTILNSGTDEQRERFAEPIMRGTQRWCQLFSEPGAGSDLASLVTRAQKVDGGWLVNGHKIWTSSAHVAQFGAMLARTDPDAPKHRGISYFLVDMSSPGIEISPIKQASGHFDFNEVFLTDVFVPDEMLVGEPGHGWDLAVATMAVERTAIGNYVNIDRSEALRRMADVDGPDHDSTLQALGEIEAHTTAIKAMVLRETLRLVQGQGPGPTSSIAKYAMVLLLRRASTATLGLTGRLAMLEDSDPAVIAPYFDMPSELIGGGTAEIQLTIIASMILGLPRK
ncbi:alkylation response protein AidB-like acyl-CoA dehydrogenase [Mycolicibacterium sp. BK556]|uniref:acyl-CoA dehydrogenase n=1 Tax=unclassified Mycolicibacterium TaxID=2636767 RepID=UPI00160E9437|nr:MULTISPECIES: acyl-CoA dehydrogenase [unclassified Mycolicibacterium]MBB3601156.1 alkylation response protein AidB-like acyl-CoA dehydrogenase [Mycolicibacterium sp. BK556]MBB3630909.1 alkylation response protein AidB-like acyl-CoA dehydrogenase [Mycolicibacterium sp. BK607]